MRNGVGLMGEEEIKWTTDEYGCRVPHKHKTKHETIHETIECDDLDCIYNFAYKIEHPSGPYEKGYCRYMKKMGKEPHLRISFGRDTANTVLCLSFEHKGRRWFDKRNEGIK